MALTEYDVCYATKEYLKKKGYTIVTWNPPGSQGTFTIPNPAKDPNYKGQTGSESPDLIVINNQEILFVEAKDNINSSYDDIIKLKNMLSNRFYGGLAIYLSLFCPLYSLVLLETSRRLCCL